MALTSRTAFSAGLPRITGFFTVPLDSRTELTDAFLLGLREQGLIAGQNATVVFKSTNGKSELTDAVAKEVVEQSDIVVTWGVLAATSVRRLSTEISLVMASIGDPIKSGLVQSVSQPGGNTTGFSLATPDLFPKRLQIFRDFIPECRRVAYLYDSSVALESALELQEIAEIKFGLGLKTLSCSVADEIEKAIYSARLWNADAIDVPQYALFAGQRANIMKACLRERIPAAGYTREFAEAGAIFSYGASINDLSRRAATYVRKILNGDRPSSLPVQFPEKFEFVVNLKSAAAFGLTSSNNLLAQASELID